MEGELVIKYGGCCDDLINILLKNGYSLSIGLINEGEDLKILYCK